MRIGGAAYADGSGDENESGDDETERRSHHGKVVLSGAADGFLN